jgi:hypothetical protein
VSLYYSCLRKKLVSDELSGHDIRSMTLSLTRRQMGWLRGCMGPVCAEMSCRHVETVCDSLPLSPPNGRRCERGIQEGRSVHTLALAETLFYQTQSETKLCGDVFCAEDFPNSREMEERINEVTFLKASTSNSSYFRSCSCFTPRTPQELSKDMGRRLTHQITIQAAFT